jgi:hypothetical protein
MVPPSDDGSTTTASKNTEGAPDSAWSAGNFFPFAVVTPPIFGATKANDAPSF